MKTDRVTIAIVSIMILVVLSGIIFLVIHFSSLNSKSKSNIVDDVDLLQEKDISLYNSKLEAYEDFVKDSIFKAEQENIDINIDNLFSSDKKKNVIPGDNENPAVEKKHGTTSSTSNPILRTAGTVKKKNTSIQNKSFKESPRKQESPPERRDFYTITSSSAPDVKNSLFINAVVHGEQKIKNNSTVKLRITQDAVIDDCKLPINTYVYGICSMQKERLIIKISSIKLSGKIIKTNLTVFDNDAIEGIYIPGLMMHKISGEITDDVLDEASVYSPSVSKVPLRVIRNEKNEEMALLSNGYKVLIVSE